MCNKCNFKILIVFLLFGFLFPLESNAQMWKRYRYEVYGGLGTTNFMGELGGGKREPSRFMGLRDIDLVATRPLVSVGARYKITELFATNLNFAFGVISGDDKLSGELGREGRNMHFKSNVYQVTNHFEFFVLKDRGKRFISQETKFINNVSIYLTGGVGVCFFNPKAMKAGEWHELQPLGTEGQGLPSDYLDIESPKNPDFYKLYAVTVPIGIGVRYNLSRRQMISLELTNHYTSTDYIDDVSGSYYDHNTIWQERGEVAAYFADRHEYLDDDGTTAEWKAIPHGAPYRGNSDFNDAYIFLTISYVYKLKTTGKGLPKF